MQNGFGHTWIWRNDQSTGAPHTYMYLGDVDVASMAITHLFSGNPLLLFRMGTDIGQVTLPLDGDAEFDDLNTRYTMQGYVDVPDIDLGFPDEDKIGFTVRVIADNLVSRNRYLRIEASIDGGPYIELGYVTTSPSGEVRFPLGTVAKRIALRIWFYTDDDSQSPKLWGFSLRVSLNTKVYRLFVFQTRLPAGSFSTLADDLQNPYLQIIAAWRIRAKGIPVPYQDPWNDPLPGTGAQVPAAAGPARARPHARVGTGLDPAGVPGGRDQRGRLRVRHGVDRRPRCRPAGTVRVRPGTVAVRQPTAELRDR